MSLEELSWRAEYRAKIHSSVRKQEGQEWMLGKEPASPATESKVLGS